MSDEPRSRAAEENVVRDLDDPRKDELVSAVVGFDLRGKTEQGDVSGRVERKARARTRTHGSEPSRAKKKTSQSELRKPREEEHMLTCTPSSLAEQARG